VAGDRPFEFRLPSSAKIGHVGFYFAKTGCIIEAGFADILGSQLWDIASVEEVFCSALNSARSTHNFCSQKIKWPEPFRHGVAISFLPLF
jgi:hypothetical protein